MRSASGGPEVVLLLRATIYATFQLRSQRVATTSRLPPSAAT
jgi:hypothetical protein